MAVKLCSHHVQMAVKLSSHQSINTSQDNKSPNNICTEPKLKIDEFANSVYQDEAAHNELPHLDLHCLPSSI